MSERTTTTTTSGVKPPEWFWEKHHRTAQVVLRNNTSSNLVGASIAHKYSEDYKDKKSWGIIKPGHCSPPMTVNYTTGDFTTGRDWWLVSFATGEWFCHTDPDNLRSLVDFLEKVAPGVIAKLVGIAIRVGQSRREGPPPPNFDEMVDAAEKATESLVKLLLNNESTAGFKQHILRDEDANRFTEIIINADWSVTFHSPSGESETKLGWIKK